MRRQRAIRGQCGDGFIVHAKQGQPIALRGHGGMGCLERALRFAKLLGLLRLSGLESSGGRGGLGLGGSDVARLLRLGLCERGLGGLHVSGGGLLGRFSTLEFRGSQRTFGGQLLAARKKFRGPLQHRLGGIELALCLRHGGGIFC